MLRQALQSHVHNLVGFASDGIDLDRGDGGLFGPGSAAWRVHGDFTSMMIGGIAALLLQMLHPGALAGVWDHSNFRADMRGRLRRTAQFIAGTTYGSSEQAERLIGRVRAIHDRVHGQLPDGSPYSANDPALLTWVHVAEVSCFLDAYRRYRDPSFRDAAQDRYLAETAEIAWRLGAVEVPTSRAALAAYLTAVRPQLRVDHRTREVAAALLSQSAPNFTMAPFSKLMLQAGVDLLPRWAGELHGFRRLPRPLLEIGVHGVGTALRWALRDGSAKRAQRRMGVTR